MDELRAINIINPVIRIYNKGYAIGYTVEFNRVAGEDELSQSIVEDLTKPVLPLWFVRCEYVASKISITGPGYWYLYATRGLTYDGINIPITTTTVSPNRVVNSNYWRVSKSTNYCNNEVKVYPPPSSFDDIAQVLAVRVLENDTTAARVLHDRMCELVGDGNI